MDIIKAVKVSKKDEKNLINPKKPKERRKKVRTMKNDNGFFIGVAIWSSNVILSFIDPKKLKLFGFQSKKFEALWTSDEMEKWVWNGRKTPLLMGEEIRVFV